MSKKDEIKELKNCIKEKDRRITKIEDSFKLYKNWILSIFVSLLCLLPLLLMVLFLEPVPSRCNPPLSLLIFGIIGVAVTVIFLIGLWVWLIIKIWEV